MRHYVIIIVGFILFISLSGCIDEDVIETANSEDISLRIIPLDDNKIHINDEILITIELVNIAEKPIKFRNNFFLGGGLTCIIIDTNNQTIVNEELYKDRELKTEALKKGEKKSMVLDLKIMPLEFQKNSTSFSWLIPGKYRIHFGYDDNGINLISNEINIELE